MILETLYCTLDAVESINVNMGHYLSSHTIRAYETMTKIMCCAVNALE